MSDSRFEPGPIPCEGCAFDDFRLTDHLPPHEAPAVIERDRLIMAARPGFNRKLLPLRVEPESNTAYCGGRYLFDTFENAQAFGDWCANEFAIDGVLILERPDFADVTAQVFRVVGAHDFKDVHEHQVAYRTETWRISDPQADGQLINQWPALRDRAGEEGHSAIWFLYNEDAREVSLVTIWDRVGESSASDLDFETLRAFETAPSYGEHWVSTGIVNKTFDRTHWVFTIWFPNDGSDKPSLWPNSPPLPAP